MRLGWCQANTTNIALKPDASQGRAFACQRLASCSCFDNTFAFPAPSISSFPKMGASTDWLQNYKPLWTGGFRHEVSAFASSSADNKETLDMCKAKWLIKFVTFFSAIALLFVLARCAVCTQGPAPESFDPSTYYYGDAQKIPLAVSTEFIAVRLREGIPLSQIEPLLRTIPCLESLSERQEIPTPRLTLLRTKPGVSEDEVLGAVANLRLHPQVAFANPVYVLPGSKLILTDEFIAQFKRTASFQDIADFNEKHGVEIVRQLYGMPNAYVLRVSPNSGKDALEMANIYHEGGGIIEYSHPDFVRIMNFSK